MSPTVLEAGPYRLFFFSSDRGEPPHVHVARERKAAKFEVQGKEVDGYEWVRVSTVSDDRCRGW